MPKLLLNGLDLNSQKAINILDPTAAQDAATKNYVDASHDVIDPRDHAGLMSWNFDGAAIGGSADGSILVGGQTLFNRLRIPATSTITGVAMYITVASSGLTHGFVALYSVSGTTATRVAVSADTTATWATGTKKIAFTGTYAASAGIYYVGLLTSGTTQPTLGGTLAVTGNVGYAAAPWRWALQTATSQTATPASIDLSSGMGSTVKSPWIGLY